MVPRAATLASDFPVRRLQDLEVEAGPSISARHKKNLETLDPIQPSSCEGGASEMLSFWDPLQLTHEISHQIREPLEDHG